MECRLRASSHAVVGYLRALAECYRLMKLGAQASLRCSSELLIWNDKRSIWRKGSREGDHPIWKQRKKGSRKIYQKSSTSSHHPINPPSISKFLPILASLSKSHLSLSPAAYVYRQAKPHHPRFPSRAVRCSAPSFPVWYTTAPPPHKLNSKSTPPSFTSFQYCG